MKITAKFSFEVTRSPKPEPEPGYIEVEDEGSIVAGGYLQRADDPEEPSLGFSLERSSW